MFTNIALTFSYFLFFGGALKSLFVTHDHAAAIQYSLGSLLMIITLKSRLISAAEENTHKHMSKKVSLNELYGRDDADKKDSLEDEVIVGRIMNRATNDVDDE